MVYAEISEFPVKTINLKDPSCWPNLWNKFRILIVEKQHYYVDRTYNFPSNDESRHF